MIHRWKQESATDPAAGAAGGLAGEPGEGGGASSLRTAGAGETADGTAAFILVKFRCNLPHIRS